MTSPTVRTLRELRRLGYTAAVVERWLPRVNVRQDLFGCMDILAVHRQEPGVLAVQTTTAGNLSARLTKARARPELAVWLKAGNRFEVWGWQKHNGRWQARRVAVRAEDLAQGVAPAVPRRRRKRDGQRVLFG